MSKLKNTAITLIISIMYCVFFERVAEMLFKHQPMCTRNSNRFVCTFVIGIIGIGLSRYFAKKNTALKYGFLLGGILLASKMTISYWTQMNQELQVAIIGFGFAVTIWYAYHHKDSLINKNKKGNNKSTKKEEVEITDDELEYYDL